MKKNFFLISIVLLLSFFALFEEGRNNRAYAVGLTIQPVKISQTMEPGQESFGIITLSNASEEDVNVETKVEDFVPLAGTYNIQFVGRAAGVTTVRDWITIDTPKSFVLRKGESRAVNYAIKAPDDAEPGGHFGVIFFKASRINSEEQFKVSTQVGVLAFVTIPGNFLQKGEINSFTGPKFVQKGPIVFKINFENTGTVHFEPKGEIKITNIFGKEVAKIAVEGQAVLPTGARDLTAEWPVKFLIGRHKADLAIKDGEGNELTASGLAFYALPVWYILGFISLIVAIFFGLKFLRKKVRFSVSINK